MKSRAFGLVLLGGLLLSAMPHVATASSPQAVTATAVDDSAARIRECSETAIKKGNAKVDILFVIDTSTSLQDSDPFGERVRAMESVITWLKPADQSEKQRVQIRVRFLAFGSRVQEPFTPGWQEIESFDASQLKEFGSMDDDHDTDYVGAIIEPGGVAEILARAKGESNCQVVLWFTDGKVHFEKKGVGPRFFPWLQAETGNGRVSDRETANKAIEVSERILCEKGKSRERAVADDLRFHDNQGSLTVIGVGLDTTTSQDNFKVLRRLLEAKDCGDLAPVGFLVEVTSQDDLARDMRRAIYGGIDPPPVCFDKGEGGNPTSIDTPTLIYIAEPVERADLFLRAREEVSEIQLVRRHGQRDSTVITLFKDGLVTPPFELAGISVKTSQLDDAPTFETTLLFKNPTEEWVGHWALQACNKAVTGPAKLDADVLIRGCIAFDLAVSSKEFVVGRADGIYLVLQRCSDASRLSTVSAISLSAVLLVDGKSVRATLGEDESLLKVPFTPTVASLGGATNKNVKLQVVELNASYEVLKGSRPVVLEWSKRNSIFDISLRLPPKTPYVEQLGCGSISKRSKSVVCEFRAVASDVEGRVLTDGPEIELSKSLGNVKFAAGSSATFPLKVKPGQPETFAYTFELAGVRTNTENVNQAFEIVFVYETDGEPREKGVFTGEFVVEPDFGITPDWGRAILFALGGLLTALLILIIARWFTARIQIPESGLLWVATVELPQCDAESVRSALLSPHAAASSLPLSPSPFGVRSLESNGPFNTTGSSLQARAGWRFLSELGYVQVSSASGCVVGSGGVMPTKRSGRIPLSLTKEWWVVSNWQGDGTAESVEDLASQIVGSSGRLVYITAGSESSRTFLEDLARRIESTWSGSVDSFATAIWKKKSKLIDKSTPPTPPLPEI